MEEDGLPDVMSQEEYSRYTSPAPASEPVTTPVTTPGMADDGLPDVMTPEEYEKLAGQSSRPGAFARGASEGVIPGLAGMAGGIWAGGKTGGLIGSSLGPWGAAGGAILGGLAGGLAAGYGASKLQDVALEATGQREGEGWFSSRQRATDEALFPHSRFAGEMTPALLTLRPGKTLDLAARGIGAGIGGVVGAATDYVQTGHVDPVKVAMGTAAGAALPHVNRPTWRAMGAAGMPRSYMPAEDRRAIYPLMESPAPFPHSSLAGGAGADPNLWQGGAEGPGAWQGPRGYQGPREPAGPRAPSDVERQYNAAMQERDRYSPQTDPAIYEAWDRHASTLAERMQAERTGYADAETTASQGQGPASTPRTANPTVNQSGGLGTSPTASPVREASSGNPVGAPMFNREAARPNAPTRNYDKGIVTPAEPGPPKVDTNIIPADIQSVFGADVTPARPAPAAAAPAAPAPGNIPVQRAASGSAPGAFARGGRPQLQTPRVTPRAAPPPRAAPERPVTAPVTPDDVRAKANDYAMAAGGRYDVALNNLITDLSNKPEVATAPWLSDVFALLKAAAEAPTPRKTRGSAPKTPAAPAATAAPAAAAAPAAWPAAAAPVTPAVAPVAKAPPVVPMPAATAKAATAGRGTKAPPVQAPEPPVAKVPTKQEIEQPSRRPEILRRRAAGQTDAEIAAALGIKPGAVEMIAGKRQQLQSAEEVLAARAQAAPKVDAPIPEQAAPAAGTAQQPVQKPARRKKATQAAIEGRPPDFAAMAPEAQAKALKDAAVAGGYDRATLDKLGEKVVEEQRLQKETGSRDPFILQKAQRRRADQSAETNVVRQGITKGRAQNYELIVDGENLGRVKQVSATSPGRKSERLWEAAGQQVATKEEAEANLRARAARTKQAAPEVTAPVTETTSEASQFRPKENTRPLEQRAQGEEDPLAGMTQKELEFEAKKEGIDTSKEGWIDTLRGLWSNVSGAIDIGPEIPGLLRPRFTVHSAREKVARWGIGLLDRNSETIADILTALSRGSSRWALNTVDDLRNKYPGLDEAKPNIVGARKLLAERAEEEPVASRAAETDIPGPKAPHEVKPEPETTLPEMPVTGMTMVQKDPHGVVVREAPYDVDTLYRWNKQFPDHPISMRESRGKRPPTAEPEPLELPTPVTAAETRTGTPSGEYTPPGKFTPRTIIDEATGEPRQTRLWTDEDIKFGDTQETKQAGKDVLSSYTPEQSARVLEYIGTLNEEGQKAAGEMWGSLPKEKFYPAVEQMLANMAADKRRAIRSGRVFELSNGVKVASEPTYRNNQGVLDINERAYGNNERPGEGETNAQTIARAAKMVAEADEELAGLVAELRKEFPNSPDITGKYNPSKGESRPAGTVMLNAARHLGTYKKPKAEHVEKFRESERFRHDGGLESKERAIEGDIGGARFIRQGKPEEGGIDIGSLPDKGLSRADRIKHRDTINVESTNRIELANWVDGLDDYKYDMLRSKYGETFDVDIQESVSPIKLRKDLENTLIEAQAERNKIAFEMPTAGMADTTAETAPTSRVTSIGPPLRSPRPNEPGKPSAGEKRKLVPGTPEFKRAVAEYEQAEFDRWVKEAKLHEEDEHTARNVETNLSLLQRAENFFSATTWTRGEKTRQLIHELRANESGALDVSKIFDWIDKTAKKFSPDREPMVPSGMIRLYKGRDGKWRDLTHYSTSDMAAATREYANKLREDGLTNAEIGERLGVTPLRASALIGDYKHRDVEGGYTPSRVLGKVSPNVTHYVDVPVNVIEQYRDGNPGVSGKAADRLAKKWDEQIDIKLDAPDTRPFQPEPSQMGTVDFLRRLWADEKGALNIGNWVPNVRNRISDFFTPGDENAVRYASQVMNPRWVKTQNQITQDKADQVYGYRKATYEGVEGGTIPMPEEANRMRHAFESRSESSLPARDQKYITDHIEPLAAQHSKLYNEVRDIWQRNKFSGHEDMPELVDNGPGYARYMPRVEERPVTIDDSNNPIYNRSNMSLWDKTIEPRGWFEKAHGPNGKRELYHVNDDGDIAFYHNGNVVRVEKKSSLPDKFNPQQIGHKFADGALVDNAYQRAIEAHGSADPERAGNTKPKYYENPIFLLHDGIEGLNRLKQRGLMLEEFLKDPEFRSYIHTNKKEAEKLWGPGNVAKTKMPQFEGKWINRNIAYQLDDMVKMGFDYGPGSFQDWLARTNMALRKPFYFVGPQVHVWNILDEFINGRGWRNLNLPETSRLFFQGLRSVRFQDHIQDEITRIAGGNPMFAHALTARFRPNMARTLGMDFKENPWRWDPIRLATGYDIKPQWERVYQGSDKGMWWEGDVLYTTMYLDWKNILAGKKLKKQFDELYKLNDIENPTAEQAARRDELRTWNADIAKRARVETEKVISSYVVPATFGKTIGLEGTPAGRFIQQFLTDPATANFGRFSYSLYKSVANVVKNMAGKNENLSPIQSSALGFSQAAMLLAMATWVMPKLSELYSKLPWAKPESEVEARGMTSMAKLPYELAEKGGDGWSKISNRIWSPSIPVSALLSLIKNRDPIGRPLFDPSGGWGAVPGQAAEFALNTAVSPAGGVSRSYAQEGPGYALTRFIESNFGLKTPSDAQVRYELRRPQEEKRKAKSRERHPRGVFEQGGNALYKMIRGYEDGGLVTAMETGGVVPTVRR